MGVYMFVCRNSGSEWSAKQTSGGEIEASASSAYDLQRNLVQATLSCDSSVVSSAFNLVTPSSAVFEVIVGGSFVSNSEAAAPASSVSGVVAASVAPAAGEKKEELEESDDDNIGGIFEEFDIFG